jgi:Tol biopolymer transport system component
MSMRRLLCRAVVWLGLCGAALVTVPSSTLAAGSGDGTIAFMSGRGAGNEVWVMRADGLGQARLTSTADPAWEGDPAYSPDGRRIAYTCGNFDVCVMNSDGSDQVRVSSHPWSRHAVVDEAPTWSPDGTQLAFDRFELGRDRLYTVNVDGAGLHRLTSGAYDENAAWSPDGTRIAFDGVDRYGDSQIFVVNVDGSGRHQLTRGDTTWAVTPAWSPDGQQLVYAQASDFFGAQHLRVVRADGTRNHAVTNGPWDDLDPTWSPDGQSIAFDSNEGYQTNIWSVSVDGTSRTQLTHGGGFNITPSWQPVLTAPQAPPLQAGSGRPPSRPTPEARLIATFYRAQRILYDDVAGLSHISTIGAVTLGDRLLKDASILRRRTVGISPRTKWGKQFKRQALAMYATVRLAGEKFNAAIVDALKGQRRRAQRDATAALNDVLRALVRDENHLDTLI